MEISMLVGRIFYFDRELVESKFDPMIHEILQEDNGLLLYSCGGPSMKMAAVDDLIDDITLFDTEKDAVAWIRIKRETAERKGAAGKAGMN